MIGKMVNGSQGVMNYGPYSSSIPLNMVIGDEIVITFILRIHIYLLML